MGETTGAGGTSWNATYTAGPGEVNQVTVVRSGRRLVFHEAAAQLAAGQGCRRDDERTVTCERAGVTVEVRVFGGDLDDRIRIPDGVARGGAGGDALFGGGAFGSVLYGEEGDDEVHGGAGGDSIVGGLGHDRLFGEGGDDRFDESTAFETEAAPADLDHLDGGPGFDRVTYSRRETTSIDLRARRGGQEGDELVDIEGGLLTRKGRLVGDGMDNELRGFSGNVLVGGAGHDMLEGGDEYGSDVLDGGSGDDELVLSGYLSDLPAPDRLRCGPGRDSVRDPAPNSLLPADCERATFDEYDIPQVGLPGMYPRGTLATLFWAGDCDGPFARRCTAAVRVHAARWGDRTRRATPGRLLGGAKGSLTERRPRLAAVPSAAGRRLLASGRCVLARVRMTVEGSGAYELLVRLGRKCRPPAPVVP